MENNQNNTVNGQNQQINPYTDFADISAGRNAEDNQAPSVSEPENSVIPDGSHNTDGFGDIGNYASAAAVKNNSKPMIITLICVIAAVLLAGGLILLLTGGGSSYEKAERKAFGALSGAFDISGQSESADAAIDITLSPEIAEMAGIGDIGKITAVCEVIEEGYDAYINYGANAMGISLSAAIWSSAQQYIMQLPELSQYYLLLGNSGSENRLDVKELEKTLDRIVSKYFELTKDAEVTKGVTVEAGGFSASCDKYTINMDERFLYELTKESLLAVAENENLIGYIDGILGSVSPYEDINAGDIISEDIKNLSESEADLGDEVIISMDVYISGKDIIRRDITAGILSVSYACVKNGNDYINTVDLSADNGYGVYIVNLTDIGSSKGGSDNGEISVTLSDGALQSYSGTIKYSDCKTYKNGLFSGKIDITVPAVGLVLNTDSAVSGNTQITTGSLSVLTMQVCDLTITVNTGTGKKITQPALTGANTLDINNESDMEKFAEDLTEAFSAMGLDSLLGSLMPYGNYDYDYSYDYAYDEQTEDDWGEGSDDLHADWTDEDWENYFNELYADWTDEDWENYYSEVFADWTEEDRENYYNEIYGEGWETRTDEEWEEYYSEIHGDGWTADDDGYGYF